MLERSGLLPGSHDHKALIEILETYPRDELFQITSDELLEIALGILHLGERRRVRLFVRRDVFGRFLSCLVFIPRERFNTENRRKIQEILQEAFGGESADYTTRISESVLARLHYVVYTEPGSVPDYDVAEIEARLAAATRAWTDDLRDALVDHAGDERAVALHERYGDSFPGAYRDDFTPRQAVHDIDRIERLASPGRPRPQPLRPAGLDRRPARLQGRPRRPPDPALGRAAAAREHGRAGQRRAAVRAAAARTRPGLDLRLRAPARPRRRAARRGAARDASSTRSSRSGAARPRTTASTASSSRRASPRARSRSCARSRSTCARRAAPSARPTWRTRSPSTRTSPAASSSSSCSGSTRRVRPTRTSRRERSRTGSAGIVDGVASLDEDRILRGFLQTVRAVLRTNYFQADEDGRAKPYLSLKLDPKRIPDLPEPRPMFEVYVYSTRVEAVHLRGGKVARGGIRWSDRKEDFRTEVLGLMKAQIGQERGDRAGGGEGRLRRQAAAGRRRPRRPARGGRRVLPHLHARPARHHRHDRRRRGRAAARRRPARRGRPVPRRRGRQGHRDVLGHRERDLGRSTGSGSATRSRRAGRPATTTRRWGSPPAAPGSRCGGTSASSGSTSRRTDFTAVGIGDMSGDVFGNGMLLSRHIKLVGAFDHRHVFLDPDPDPEQSYARARAPLRAAGLVLGRLRRGADLAGRRRLLRAPPSRSRSHPRCGRRSASRPSR